MVKILLLTPFKEVYRDIATYTLNEYGKTTLRKFTEEFTNITRRLAYYPTSSPEEPLLKKLSHKYRSIIFRKNFKIIYRYEETSKVILLVDIWDMRMSTQNLMKKFKKKDCNKYLLSNSAAIKTQRCDWKIPVKAGR